MKNKKILTISLSGIGNTILFIPFLNSLRKNYPLSKIDLLVLNKAMADIVSDSNSIDSVFVLVKQPLKILMTILKLRKVHYDYSVIAFPSNKWQFNVLAFLIGAKNRVTHKYNCCYQRTLSFLQNRKIKAIEGIHDVEQNMNLLKAFGINQENEKRELTFYISKENENFSENFLRENQLKENLLIGIHPGAGGGANKNWQGFSKRWPEENFVKLCDKLIEKRNAKILVFGGPEEMELKNEIKNLSKYKENVIIVNESFKHTAAIIRRCNLFISNDSGLMHVAVAVRGPKVIGIFGPTDYKRTAPYSKNSLVVRKEMPCSPCLKYPFHSVSSKIKCNRNFECLRKIKVEDVIKKIDETTK